MKQSPSHFVRCAQPRMRDGVYDLYWTFASRRQAAFEARLAGRSRPWTTDPILQVYKFCNVFRASDRVSQYMIRDVAYGQTPIPMTGIGFSRSQPSALSATSRRGKP